MTAVEVYLGDLPVERRVGRLEFDEIRGREVSSLVLDDDFVRKPPMEFMGPDIGIYAGRQYPTLSAGFGMFQDAAPDSWGRRLIRRREKRANLRESDYLLGVFDLARVGALRFKLAGEADFAGTDAGDTIPPWTYLRTLEESAMRFEADNTDDSALAVLLKPGSSLGGARPKASVTAPDGSLWIAKFPSKEDDIDTGAWEYLVHELAQAAGLRLPLADMRRFSRNGTTFLCRRFDREGSRRIHFASAMTMLGCEDRQEHGNGTYLDIAAFIMQHGAQPDADLHELWRRMAFSVMVSNTDDHLRNHGFVLENGKWRLSPAYDLNANAKRPGELSLELEAGVVIDSTAVLMDAKEYFRLNGAQAEAELARIRQAVGKWREVAVRLGIPRHEQEGMARCFARL